ncbi:MAG: PilZ domain-containing protein [Syntrophobacteraceae bacterium]|nr:PilZ domain-containing protein [Syntrophobacteraceae bacterium]
MKEKREFERFKVKEGAFAAFVMADGLINMGQIRNISMSGLCLSYLASDLTDRDYTAIKIFGSNERFIHLNRIPCKVVYDHEVPETSWEQISMRRCGVEFESMSVQHRSVLQDFIDQFGVETHLHEDSQTSGPSRPF